MQSALDAAALVGYRTAWYEHQLDSRWAMAYAAGLGDMRPAYFDNTDGRPLATHPLFPVCLEWPALVASLEANDVDMHRTVHATHDLHFERALVPPARLATRGTIIGVEQRKPGIYLVWRFDTVDSDKRPVCRTWQGNLFLGAQLVGNPHWEDTPPVLPTLASSTAPAPPIELALPANLSHVYTECARIWNPLHTDAAVAAAAGVGQPILHGTATLALAVNAAIDHANTGKRRTVRRLGGRFTAMVTVPGRLRVLARAVDADTIAFSVLNDAGAIAIRDGYICF
jgi:hypothetical protein